MTTKRRTPAPARTVAAIYVRVSLDATGEHLAVDRQKEDCLALARSRGWDVMEPVFTDNSVSAAGKRRRPDFEAALEAVESGQAQVLVAWSLDRLTRNDRDKLRLVEVGQRCGLIVALVRGSDLDMSTAAGRFTSKVLGDVAQHEIEVKSERQRRALQQRADHGRPPLGVRLTGYTTGGDVIPSEARMVRELFDRFAAGESLKGLVRWLTDHGYTTRRGNPWVASTVRTILLNPRYAGRVRYCGNDVGEGQWRPLVDADTFALVQHRLTDVGRRTQQGTDRKHLGSGLYRCSACGEPMRGWSGARYRCRNGHHSRSGSQVDGFVEAVIVRRLQQPDVAQLLADAGKSDRAAALLEEAKTLTTRLRNVEADYDDDVIDGRRYAAKRDKITAALAAVERERAALLVGTGPAAVLAAPSPADAYQAASLMVRRQVIDALVDVVLHPQPPHSKTFDPATVQITWRS